MYEQDKEDELSLEEKHTCQTLLLTIIAKEKLFSKAHRDTAKKLLQRLEGDRRRKCRTSNIGAEAVDTGRFAPTIRKELLIVSSKKKRKGRPRKQKGEDDESDSDSDKEQRKKRPRKDDESLDEDGFKKHSDDEGEWSDVDDGT